MNKKIPLLIFSLSSILSIGQNSQENKISELVNQLNWNTVKIENDLTLFVTQSDSASNNLVKIGKPATEFLLKAIKIPEKTVASHVILTRIYEAKNYINHSSGTIPIYENCHDLIGKHHFFNGINWKLIFGKEQSISQNQIDLASNYWNKKLILEEKIKLPNGTEIFETLDKENKVNYPCNEDKSNNTNNEKNSLESENKGKSQGKSNFTLVGRRVDFIPKIDNKCNSFGKVVIEVTVNKSGKTISAVNKEGSTADACLIDLAKKYALNTKWQPRETAAEKQVGTITYNFTYNFTN